MKLPRRNFLHLAAGAAALPAVSRIARAQAYPTRPVRIIAGYPPGGSIDIHARLIGQWLSPAARSAVRGRKPAGSRWQCRQRGRRPCSARRLYAPDIRHRSGSCYGWDVPAAVIAAIRRTERYGTSRAGLLRLDAG
jgi:hypothetical protein